uniref:Uncharacterized protein n=1 Tax=Anguilla anguilla TaxID=7936 RepID=A0A0E9RAE2_ANGAN
MVKHKLECQERFVHDLATNALLNPNRIMLKISNIFKRTG